VVGLFVKGNVEHSVLLNLSVSTTVNGGWRRWGWNPWKVPAL